AGNTLTIAPTSTITGNVLGSGTDRFQLGGTGNGSFDLSSIGPSAQYQGFDTFNVISGTWTVFNTFGQSQAWNVNGGTLAGTGTLSSVNVNNGGTLAPGPIGTPGAMTITGNLPFQSCAFYLAQVTPATASIANVGWIATLTRGLVPVAPLAGSAARPSDIRHAAGGLGGTTFSGVNATNFNASLSYSATDVFLNLTAALGAGTALNQNQQNVANAINSFANAGNTLPPNFLALFGLTGGNLANALTLVSGEAATGAQQGAFQLGGQFLNIMLDPFVDGRGGGASGHALGFAPEQHALPEDVELAYANVLKAPVTMPRWSVW